MATMEAKSPAKQVNLSAADTIDPYASSNNRTRSPSKAVTIQHSKTPTKEDYSALDLNFDQSFIGQGHLSKRVSYINSTPSRNAASN